MKFIQKLKNFNGINVKRFFVSALLLFNIETYGSETETDCRLSWAKETGVVASYENNSPKQSRTQEHNHFVDYLRSKYPVILNAEQEKELIAKYQKTKDPEALEQILSSIVRFIWRTVRRILFRFSLSPSLADDLLQEAVIKASDTLKTYDITSASSDKFFHSL